MFTIGDFARHGRVSVRMLRHYDAIGLLRPDRVDPRSGYRYYAASQFSRLNRIVALKDLGFTLEQVAVILGETISAEQLRGMLRLRQAELRSRISADEIALAQVEARLAIIEMEGAMPANDIQVKAVAPVRVAELSAPAAAMEPAAITPVIRPLFDQLAARLGRAGIGPAGPAIAYYQDAERGVIVHAAMPVNAGPRAGGDFLITDLPEVPEAATIIHRGPMSGVLATVQSLAWWIEANGYRSTGYPRELSLECPADDEDAWVTELQEPVTRPGSR